MSDASIEEAKTALRLEARRRRKRLHQLRGGDASRAVAELFTTAVAPAPDAVIGAYWPIRDELDIRPLIASLMDGGYRVCLPVVAGEEQPLVMRMWLEGAPLFEAGFGTLAPAEDAPVAEPDILLVPLLAFDAQGTRLGYGGGYYDRTLAAMAKRPTLIGFAFSGQQVDEIPHAAHDVPLDMVVTEDGVRRFDAAAAA